MQRKKQYSNNTKLLLIAVRVYVCVWRVYAWMTLFLAWAWLAKAKGHSCHTKKSTLAKVFTKKKRVKVRSTTGHYATKKRPVKITMYLGLDIIIKLSLQEILIDVQY